MKTKLLLSVLLSGFYGFSQPEWREVLSPPDSGRFDDVFFIDQNLGWAAGNGGYVFRTTDGGQHWDFISEFPGQYIRNIEFLDADNGFLGLLDYSFYRTTDGGVTWADVMDDIPTPDGPLGAICGMDGVGTQTLYGCGAFFGPAYIIKSTDAGATWQYIDMSAYADSLVEVLFVDANTGYASGGSSTGGVILRTTDGGANWTPIYDTGIPGEYVWKLQRLFFNPNVMFGSVESVAPLNGKLIRSVDGGVSWTSKEVPDTDIQAVGFVSETHGWMGGHHTGFLETFDAGTTWTNTGFGANLNRIQFFDQNLAYCSGAGIYKFSEENLGNKSFVNNVREKLQVHIAPNPVGGQLDFTVNFKSPDHIILQVFDANGKLVKELENQRIGAAGKRAYSFPFPYAAGTYYLNLHNDTGAQSEMFVKQGNHP